MQDHKSAIKNPGVFTLSNKNGLRMQVTNFGARIISLFVPGRSGELADVVLGYDSAYRYLQGTSYHGAIIGRYANRIEGGKFQLNGTPYQLTKNNNGHSLHGGPLGFHTAMWSELPEFTRTDSITFSYLSKDGEEGFPGNLTTKIAYTLTDEDELCLDYSAVTDKTTVINLTSHAYFNLAGEGNGNILGHVLMINSDFYLPVTPDLIPTGEKRSVDHTPFDFRTPHQIGERIDADDEQLRYGIGYDHNWILKKNGRELSFAARATDPVSGRSMEMFTTEPGMQLYSGNFLEGKNDDIGKGGKPYRFRSAFCLEAQHFPNSPNQPDNSSVLLQPEETYVQKTIYRFSCV